MQRLLVEVTSESTSLVCLSVAEASCQYHSYSSTLYLEVVTRYALPHLKGFVDPRKLWNGFPTSWLYDS